MPDGIPSSHQKVLCLFARSLGGYNTYTYTLYASFACGRSGALHYSTIPKFSIIITITITITIIMSSSFGAPCLFIFFLEDKYPLAAAASFFASFVCWLLVLPYLVLSCLSSARRVTCSWRWRILCAGCSFLRGKGNGKGGAGRRDLTNLLGGEWKGKGLAIILNNYPALPCLVLSYLYSDYSCPCLGYRYCHIRRPIYPSTPGLSTGERMDI